MSIIIRLTWQEPVDERESKENTDGLLLYPVSYAVSSQSGKVCSIHPSTQKERNSACAYDTAKHAIMATNGYTPFCWMLQ
jgi:hypothetical protein